LPLPPASSPFPYTTLFRFRTLGHARFMDLLMTGDLLTAAQALDAGVVSRVVADDEVTETATTLARRLADGPTDSFARLKTLVREDRKSTRLNSSHVSNSYA